MEKNMEEYLKEQAKELNEEQKEQIKQVAATMSLSNIPLTKGDYQNLYAIASGKKTIEQIIAEITAKHKKEE